jgi:hypothetical protein
MARARPSGGRSCRGRDERWSTSAAQLEQEAADATAFADLLDRRVAELETVDEARALWWAHTAGTRAAADRAAAELQTRRAADGRTDPDVTAAEILTEPRADDRAHDASAQARSRDLARDGGTDHAAVRHEARNPRGAVQSQETNAHRVGGGIQAKAPEHGRAEDDDREDAAAATASPTPTDDGWHEARRAADADEDRHREIVDEHDFDDIAKQRADDHRAVEPRPHPDTAETNTEDIRDTAAREPHRGGEDQVRTPTASETADSVRRARRALTEIHARDAVDRKREAEQARSASSTAGTTAIARSTLAKPRTMMR